MVQVLGADEQVDVDEAGLGGNIEPQLDVRENELARRSSGPLPCASRPPIGVGEIVVCHRERLDLRRHGLEVVEVGFDTVPFCELVVEDSPRRVDVRFPAAPFRSTTPT